MPIVLYGILSLYRPSDGWYTNFLTKVNHVPLNAMLARYMPSLCVCVSVTLRYCIKMAKRRITQIMPHDKPRDSKHRDKI